MPSKKICVACSLLPTLTYHEDMADEVSFAVAERTASVLSLT
jgi:hypothetical protein